MATLFEFLLAAAVACAVVWLPGYLSLRALGIPRVYALCCAPLPGIALLSVLGTLFGIVGVSASPLMLLAPAVVVPLAFFLALRGRVPEMTFPRLPVWLPVFALALGAALGYNLFVSHLPSYDGMFQAYDLTQHLNVIQAMADSGSYSSLDVGYYLSDADQAIAPFGSNGFYPAAWHVVCALTVQLTGSSPALVVNASLYAFACLAWPLSMLAFLRLVFPDSEQLVVCGAMCSLSFVSFPWLLLVFGPVYPNMVGFALMPAAMCLFMRMVGEEGTVSERARCLALLIVCVAGLALLHPNTVFTCIVILAPYCVQRIWHESGKAGLKPARGALLCAAFVAFCAAVWYACYKLPAFHDIVSHVWPAFQWAWQAIVNILSQTYTMGFYTEIATQFVLAALVVIGLVCAAHRKGLRWLLAPYFVSCYIFFISITHSDELKQVLAGFWYTDPMRLAAMCSIASVPLATLGAQWVYEQVLALVRAYNDKRAKETRPLKVGVALFACFVVANFAPEFSLPGLNKEYTQEEATQYKDVDYRSWPKSVHTTFGDYRRVVEEVYAYNSPLDAQEQELLRVTAEAVPEGELVLNNPMDGSFLAYGYNGTRVYYRNFVGYGGSDETAESVAVRTGLCNIADDETVRSAVDALGAHYVLVMNDSHSDSSFINLREDYKPKDFEGISSIDENTPGFTCVYKNIAGALYRID